LFALPPGQFDDQVVADLLPIYKGDNGEEANYVINPQTGINWHSPTANLIDADDGTISASNLIGTHQIEVDVRWKLTFNAKAQVKISENLTKSSPLRAELVASSHGPGPKGLDSATNLIFLSDGFTENRNLLSRFTSFIR
jgi:hypothetical protein